MKTYEIDTDATPRHAINGAQIEYHKKSGKMLFDFKKLYFHLCKATLNGNSIIGHMLRKELQHKNVMNACVMDFLLHNAWLIPDSWKRDQDRNIRCIYFWGTIFSDPDGRLYVGYIYCDGEYWNDGYRYLDSSLLHHDRALLSMY